MTGRTHLLTGILTGLIIARLTWAKIDETALLTVTAAAGSLLPDIDHPGSWISGYIPGTSRLLNLTGVRHRTFTHSLLLVLLLIGGWYYLTTYQAVNLPWAYLAALVGGILAHNLADMLTPDGVQFLFPIRGVWKATPWNWSLFRSPLLSPVRWLLNTGLELLVSSAAVLGIVIMLFLFVTGSNVGA